MPELELIANYGCRIGENPLWHPLEKKAYWLDIANGTIYRYDPQTNAHEVFYQGEVTGGFTVQGDGALLLFSTQGAVRLLRDGAATTLIESLPGEDGNRFNDVIADPIGRVFCGTMGYTARGKVGNFYRIDPDGSVTKLMDQLLIPNGMGFSPDGKTFYQTDTMNHVIYQFDYDADSGAITNQRPFVVVSESDGIPDGMTVDSEGFIWSGNWDGWQLIRYSPDGQIERRVRFPAKKVSSVAFGGEDYTDLYVTTAGGDNLAENGETAGAFYRLNVGIKGKPEFLSRIGL